MDGWNGRICQDPASNTYCVGQYSYPGQMVGERRDLDWEQKNRGRCCTELDQIPPCIYSMNAFGSKELTAFSDPPEFFKDKPEQHRWKLPPATVCIWPYEEMYHAEGVEKSGSGYDHVQRFKAAEKFFSDIKPDHSLIFYYANYSNPFSEEKEVYVLVGLSRIKDVGEFMYYNCSPETQETYGGGYVWQRNVTSHYPHEGFRLPYHLYKGEPEKLQNLLFVPDNARNFKYATRRISDDDALDLIERFLEIATMLKSWGDTSENWSVRIAWLQSLIADLWKNRGLYPGLPKILDYLQFHEGIKFFKDQVDLGKEQETKDTFFAYLNNDIEEIPNLNLSKEEAKKIKRQWLLKEDTERELLEHCLPKFDLYLEQVERILSSNRSDYGISSTLTEIKENPYILSEGYVGNKPDDIISFSKIDHGIFPSPELGDKFGMDIDDWRRLRALCVERLKKENQHTFLTATQVIDNINERLSFLPEWKRHKFTEQYLKLDEKELLGALKFRTENGQRYIYLKYVFEDEREIENQLKFLAHGPNISFKSPVTVEHWRHYLSKSECILATENPEEYNKAIQGQVEVCENIFVRPVCILSGGAGTGKTTVIKALVKAIEKAHSHGTSVQLLAPTGKAADRIRAATDKEAETIHSFLAKRGWLNDNLTFKRTGGQQEERISTYIIDEASMLDLTLAAALFRAINWKSVQRLILVGDPNQLPPIGRGRVFADIIDWFTKEHPDNIGELKTNLRQMDNKLQRKGTGILDLASLYIRKNQTDSSNEVEKIDAEDMLRRVQEGGKVDKDLRVLYWSSPDDLAKQLTNAIVEDMESDTGEKLDPKQPHKLWNKAFDGQPEYQQVISPYRGELFGVDHLNQVLQTHNNKGRKIDHHRKLEGIALFDKVIQYRNRSKSNGIWAYNTKSKKPEQIEVFNGELGFVKPHTFDPQWKEHWFKIKRFQVIFSRRKDYSVGYGDKCGKTNKEYVNEKVEDNLELAYAISVHKAQGSEFERVYFILPKRKTTLISPELFYTGITRASKHCTLLIEEDISPLTTLHRPEKSYLAQISSSLFSFRPVQEEMRNIKDWYEEGKIHKTLADFMVRSKSEVIIANMLFERDIPFKYEIPLFAKDGTFYRPDFTITWRGEEWYWEHLGLLQQDKYRNYWETKKIWYEKFFPGRLLITKESGNLSQEANILIDKFFS